MKEAKKEWMARVDKEKTGEGEEKEEEDGGLFIEDDIAVNPNSGG